MYPTKIDLSESTRQSIAALLQRRLAESIDLALQAKQAHWNVKGPHFYTLHLLFDTLHETGEAASDLIAERIAQLGGTAEGTCRQVAKNTSIQEMPADVVNERELLHLLTNALGAYSKTLRHGIRQTDEWNDPATADVLTQVLRSIDKALWMTESHLVETEARSDVIKGAA